MAIDLDGLLAADKKFKADPDLALSLEALSGSAIRTLQEALMAGSDDVRRKAAVDILNFNKQTKQAAPLVTEEQLGYLGQVIVEAEAVRVRSLGSEIGPRVDESLS